MPLDTYLVSSVSLGELAILPQPSIANASLGLSPDGISPPAVSRVRIAFTGSTGANLTFDFTLLARPDLRFDFTPNLRPVPVPGWLDSVFPNTHAIRNLAHGVSPRGLSSLALGIRAFIAGQAGLQLNLADASAHVCALQLNFGGGALVSAPSIQGGFVPVPSIKAVDAAAQPDGFASLAMGLPRIHPDRIGVQLTLNFSGLHSATLALHFAFGGARLVAPNGIDALQAGSVMVRNLAQGVLAQGIDYSMAGRATISRAGQVAARVMFNLNKTHTLTGVNVPFVFTTAVARAVDAWGWHSMLGGWVDSADHFLRILAPGGWHSKVFGDALLTAQGGIENLNPAGWMEAAMGQPSIRNGQQFVRALSNTGYERFTEFGQATVFIPETQHARPGGIDAFGANDLHDVGYFYRFLLQHNPYIGGYIGTAYIGEKNRRVEPFWFQATQWGATLVGRHVSVLAQGFASLEWGSVQLARGREVLAIGQTLTQFGEAHRISESPQRAFVEQRDGSLAIGSHHRAYNFVQYVAPIEDYSVRLFHVVSDKAWVYNANRSVAPNGLDSFRSTPLHYIRNLGEACLLDGLEATEYGRAFISNFVRTIMTPSFESLRFVNFNMVHNAAQALYPQGIDRSSVVPKASILNLNRFYQAWGSAHGAFGQSFIAPRIRGLTALLPTDTMRIGRAYIGWLEAYLSPTSIEGTQMSPPPIVWMRPIPRITPYMPLQFRAGNEHKVWNKTPNIYPKGRPYSEFGLFAWVSHSPRYPMIAPWLKGTTWGWTHVSRRDRVIGPVVGWHSFSPPTFDTRIANAWQPLIFPQTIECSSIYKPHDEIGAHAIRGSLLQAVGWLSLAIGEEINVRMMGAIVRTYYPHTQWGVHKVNAYQFISPEGMPHSDGDNDGLSLLYFGKPRMSPHTIWAQPAEQVPHQAIRNHPESGKYNTPSPDNLYNIGAQFGRPKIPHPLVIMNAGLNGGGELKSLVLFGDLGVMLRRRFLWVAESILLRMGYPVILGGARKLRAVGFQEEFMGSHEASLHGTSIRTLSPVDNDFFVCEGAMVDLKDRAIYPGGSAASEWGDNHPMVHYPLRLVTHGVDNDLYGVATWVSYRHRPLPAEGFESDEVSYWSAGHFNDRMRVRQNTRVNNASAGIMQTIGSAQITNRQHRIFVYGVSPRCIPVNGTGIRHA